MKAIKFLLMALLPMLTISCEPQPGPSEDPSDTDTISIVGSWQLNDVTRVNSEGASWDMNEKEGQTWIFDQSGKLTIGSNSSDYALSGLVLTTKVANDYQADFFIVQTLAMEDLVLSASYEEEDKVGRRTVTYTLKFKRKK